MSLGFVDVLRLVRRISFRQILQRVIFFSPQTGFRHTILTVRCNNLILQ